MIRIRLSRRGFKNKPFFRIIAIDSSRKREGRYLDMIGYFNAKKKILNINQQKLKDWKSKGGKLSLPLQKLLKSS